MSCENSDARYFHPHDGQSKQNPRAENVAGQLLCISASATAPCPRLDSTAYRTFVRSRSSHWQTGRGGRTSSQSSHSHSAFCPTRGCPFQQDRRPTPPPPPHHRPPHPPHPPQHPHYRSRPHPH